MSERARTDISGAAMPRNAAASEKSHARLLANDRLSASSHLRRGSEAHTAIAYDGPALTNGTMDVRDLAPALVAVGELCSRANRVLNGSRATIEVRVQTGFRPGSFGVDLNVVQSIAASLRGILVSDGVTAALNLAGLLGLATTGTVSLFKLIKWLRGRRPESVTTLETGDVRISVRVEINHRIEVEYIDVPHEVAQIYNDPGVRAAAAEGVAPLKQPGITIFESPSRSLQLSASHG